MDRTRISRQTTPTQMALGNGFTLRSVQSQADADRYANFNATYVSAIQGLTCAQLLANHPTMGWDDFFFVEDERTGEMVSCICLIPWHIQLGGVALRVAMLEMVVTHPDYRHRGLVRMQIDHFHACVAAQGFDLCIIEGIPYYYRQYGYAYATDHWASDGLAVARIPAGEGSSSLHLSAASMADVEQLDALYIQSMSKLAGWTTRTHADWRYLIEGAGYPVVMIKSATHGALDDAPLGYVVAWHTETGAYIAESGIPAASTARAFLQWCQARLTGELVLGWPTNSTLVEMARTLGSSVRPADQWLWRVVDLPRLLQKLAPVLAARVAASSWAGMTETLILNLFRHAYCLRFVRGELVAVESVGFVDASMGADGGDLNIAPEAFVRLLLGYRTLDELADAWPDTGVWPSCRHLWQTLWPKQATYFWKPYMAFSTETRMLSNDISQPI